MNILVIGQCTLHWGRMEFGNIGNYYIIEPFFRELHRAFPNADIRTTLQMSDSFCRRERITTVPMDWYYAWRENELELAKNELRLSESASFSETTPYLEAVKWADLVIDFSGDIWGDNANFLGDDRFEVGLLKNLVAQRLGKPTAMLAGSPGPFSGGAILALAKEVYSKFDLVTNREPISTSLLTRLGFDTNKTRSLACPAFLFEPGKISSIKERLHNEGFLIEHRRKPIVGFIVCGWNFERGPFDAWPRSDEEYVKFAEGVEFVSRELGAQVCLMSHANGFDIPPASFRLKHGRDYPIAKHLHSFIMRRGNAEDVICLNGIYDAWETKAIIGTFDMLISGRVHAAVAGLSQSVPTVIIDYGHEPKAHKLAGFATVAGMRDYIADPASRGDLHEKIGTCWERRQEIRMFLDHHIPIVKDLARENFTALLNLV